MTTQEKLQREIDRFIACTLVSGQKQADAEEYLPGGSSRGTAFFAPYPHFIERGEGHYIYDADGRMENPGFLDYRMPVASDLPMIDTVIVEVPNPSHPFGVRGVGEVPIIPPMAAIANAVHAAVGVLFNIGMFPFIMVVAATAFFEPSWPRRLLRRARAPAAEAAPEAGEAPPAEEAAEPAGDEDKEASA